MIFLQSGCQLGCISLTPFETILDTIPADEFVQIDGQCVHIERKGTGEPLILLHGFGGSTFTFNKVMDGLADSFDVIAIDLNAFGYTERPTGTLPYTPRGQAQLVTAVMDKLDIESAHMLGHSYGAGIALLLAAETPARARSLVLVDGIAPRSSSSTVSPLLLPFVSALVQAFIVNEKTVRDALSASVHDPDTITEEMVHGYFDRIRVEGLSRGIEGLLGAANGEPINFDYANVSQPALIIWGEHDQVIPITIGEEMNAALPDSMLIRFTDSGHLPMDEEPEKFIQTVADFLSE